MFIQNLMNQYVKPNEKTIPIYDYVIRAFGGVIMNDNKRVSVFWLVEIDEVKS